MRLINARTHKVQNFLESDIPQYAILSHTWGKEEMTFQDVHSCHESSKKGYEKVKQACRLALKHELAHLWVDTVCVDKSSSAELSESINSMFDWYKNATTCLVYLEDFSFNMDPEETLAKCRWFTR